MHTCRYTMHSSPCTLSSLVLWSYIPMEHTLNNGRCTSWNFSKTWAKPFNPQALENNIIYTVSIINILIWEKFIEIKMTWMVYHFAEDVTGCCRGCEWVDGNWFFKNNYPQHLLSNSFSLSLLIFCMVKRNDVYIHKQNATAKKPLNTNIIVANSTK